jgi:hypothetical protein
VQSSYVFSVTVSDTGWDGRGQLQDTNDVTVFVVDVNERPEWRDLNSREIEENSPVLTTIGDVVSVHDQDFNNALTFEITQQTTYSEFGIESGIFGVEAGSGQIFVNLNKLNFEGTPAYDLRIRVSDKGGTLPKNIVCSEPNYCHSGNRLYVEGVVTVHVLDINEAPSLPEGPVFQVAENAMDGVDLSPSFFSVDEDTDDTVTVVVLYFADFYAEIHTVMDDFVATMTETDEYTLSVANGGGSALDFETLPELFIVLKATDSGGLYSTAEAIVQLIDVNEPPVFTKANFVLSISEKSAVVTIVGTVRAVDVDAADANLLKYGVLSGSGTALFDVDLNTGTVSYNADTPLDYTVTKVYELEVFVEDSAGNKGAVSLIIVRTQIISLRMSVGVQIAACHYFLKHGSIMFFVKYLPLDIHSSSYTV